MPGVKLPFGWVCKQVDVSACRGFAADFLKQDGHDYVTETPPLVVRFARAGVGAHLVRQASKV